MHQLQTQKSKAIRGALLGIILLSLSAGLRTTIASDTFGVESSNLGDRPPVVNPDVSLRSSELDGPPAYGPADAKVLIVLFSDFQCPHCRRASQSVHQIASEFPGDVRIEVFHHAQPEHANAEIAAIASIAAQRQGHFWGMYDKILENPRLISAAKLNLYAQELQLDPDQFASDMNDPAISERIQEEGELGRALGARGTPGFLINAKLYRGWASWKYFRSSVQRELVKANALEEQGMTSIEILNQRAIDNLIDSEQYELYLTQILLPLQELTK